jgi:chromosome partitioning protein
MTTIAIMNAKGGVGKSTLTMAMAETLSIYHKKRVLVVDGSGELSLSLMMTSPQELAKTQQGERTMVSWFCHEALEGRRTSWRNYVSGPVSDIEDARTVHLMAGDMDLPLLEREIAARRLEGSVQVLMRRMMQEVRAQYDIVLVDCAPGNSLIADCWLREADYQIMPVKPDMLGARSVDYLSRTFAANSASGYARHLGVIVNMKNARTPSDTVVERQMRAAANVGYFAATVPWVAHIEHSALYSGAKRSFQNKYPGESGTAIRSITTETLARLAAASVKRPAAASTIWRMAAE